MTMMHSMVLGGCLIGSRRRLEQLQERQWFQSPLFPVDRPSTGQPSEHLSACLVLESLGLDLGVLLDCCYYPIYQLIRQIELWTLFGWMDSWYFPNLGSRFDFLPSLIR